MKRTRSSARRSGGATRSRLPSPHHLKIPKAYVVGHDYSALVMHKFVRKHQDMTIKGLTIDPIVPGFEGRYLSVGHFPVSWYRSFIS